MPYKYFKPHLATAHILCAHPKTHSVGPQDVANIFNNNKHLYSLAEKEEKKKEKKKRKNKHIHKVPLLMSINSIQHDGNNKEM